MDGRNFVAVALEEHRHSVGAFFGGDEDEEGALLMLEEMFEKIELGALNDFVAEQIDARSGFFAILDRDPFGIAHVAGDEAGHGRPEGRREEHRVALRGQLVEDAAEVFEEAHVEHAVGFVEDDFGGLREVDQAAFEIVAETAGRGDDDFGSGLDVAQLVGFAHATDDHRSADAHAFDELAEGLIDLNGEFAGGAEDEDFDGLAARNGGESFDDGNRERKRLAGAGLRGGDDVAAGQQWRDGLRLDGRRGDKFVFVEVVPQCGAKVQFGKMLH